MATTSNGIKTSFSNTPQAKDDALINTALTEDAKGVFVFDVMANDAGGNAKSLYAIDFGSDAKRLLTKDAARSEADTTDTSELGAKIWITADGKIGYSLTDAVSQQLQSLGTGEALIDRFTYAIQLGNGTLSWATATVRVEGSNDAPVVTAADLNGAVTEALVPAGKLVDTGVIAFADAELNDAHLVSVVPAGANLGTLTASLDQDTTGTGTGGKLTWSYNVDAAAVEFLAQGETRTESFTVTLDDQQGGVVTQQVDVVITGTNDIPVIDGSATASVSEDSSAMLSTGGTLTIADADLGEAAFAVQTGVAGQFGTFGIDAEGNWDYSANNDLVQIQQLGAGDSVIDSFTVTSLDGSTSETVKVTINGTNDAAIIGVPTAASVTEDANVANGNLVATGTLSIADADLNQAQFQTPVTPAAGTLGTLTLAANGSYTYSVANSAVQGLQGNETKIDTFTVKSVDGTAKDISFTINGADETARVQPHILFVDDDGGVTSNVTWTNTLQSLGYTFDVQTLALNGNPANLQNYDMVIWSVSDRAYSNLTAQNVNTLISYLNGGGDLIYAGGHNLYDEPAAALLIQHYLGLSNYQYNMPSVSAEAHLHASGPGGSYTLSDFSDNPGFTSVYGGTMMSAFNVAKPTASVLMEITSGGAHAGHSGSAYFDAANNDVAAINDGGTYRAATLGFDLNQLDPQYRSAFLDQVIQLVGGSPWDTVF